MFLILFIYDFKTKKFTQYDTILWFRNARICVTFILEGFNREKELAEYQIKQILEILEKDDLI